MKKLICWFLKSLDTLLTNTLVLGNTLLTNTLVLGNTRLDIRTDVFCKVSILVARISSWIVGIIYYKM